MLSLLALREHSDAAKGIEILTLRHEIAVLRRANADIPLLSAVVIPILGTATTITGVSGGLTG